MVNPCDVVEGNLGAGGIKRKSTAGPKPKSGRV